MENKRKIAIDKKVESDFEKLSLIAKRCGYSIDDVIIMYAFFDIIKAGITLADLEKLVK